MNVTIRPGKRTAFSEVVFSSKPEDSSLLANLKAAGWNWHNPSGCWYGPTATLPERIKALAESQPAPEVASEPPAPVAEPEPHAPVEEAPEPITQTAPASGVRPMSELPEPELKAVWNGLASMPECTFVTDGISLLARSAIALKGKQLKQLEKAHPVSKKKGVGVAQETLDKMLAKYANHSAPARIDGWTAECQPSHSSKDMPAMIARLSSAGNRAYVNAQRLAWMLSQIKEATGGQARLMLAAEPEDKLTVVRFANAKGETIGLLVGCEPLESWHALFDGSQAHPEQPEPEPPPVAHVAKDVAEAFGISKLPNVVVVPVNQDSQAPTLKSNVIPMHQPGSLSGLKARAASMKARLAKLKR